MISDWVCAGFVGLVLAGASATRAAELQLKPVLALQKNGSEQLTVSIDRNVTNQYTTNFHALVGDVWPQGIAPVFAVTEENTFELRRLPPRGVENFAEPLFFALPLEDETNAAQIVGTWNCAATNLQGSRHYVDWQLAADGDLLGGRFDPSSEYRVAFITRGSYRAGRFELVVENSSERYILSGRFVGTNLVGTFVQQDGETHGPWIASRAIAPVRIHSSNAVPLYEWRRGEARRYSVRANEPGWQRASKPLCRVWGSSR